MTVLLLLKWLAAMEALATLLLWSLPVHVWKLLHLGCKVSSSPHLIRHCLRGAVALQAMVESLLSEYPNVLVLRVRMPIVGDLLYPRNFITKIIKYEKVTMQLHTAVVQSNSVMSVPAVSCLLCCAWLLSFPKSSSF